MGGGDLSTDVGIRAEMVIPDVAAPQNEAEGIAATSSAARSEPGHALHVYGNDKDRRRSRRAADDLEGEPDSDLVNDDGLGPSEADPHRLDQLA